MLLFTAKKNDEKLFDEAFEIHSKACLLPKCFSERFLNGANESLNVMAQRAIIGITLT